jgi:hypothetical protein
MGRVRTNNALGTIEGKLGHLAFVHCADGRVLVRMAPVRKAAFTPGELRSQSRFARAVAFVRSLRANPGAYALYQHAAQAKRKRACDLALSDFLNPPVIQDVDLSAYSGQPGQAVRIEALDSFAVQAVAVVVKRADGTLLEEGAAALDVTSGLWLYGTQSAVNAGQILFLEVSAADPAGNVATKSFHHLV